MFAGTRLHPGQAATSSVFSARPPIHVWMPNQPQATSARRVAGMFAPRTPKLARHSTGKETPYFVPACTFRIIGMRRGALPSRIVRITCAHVIPCCVKPDASVYVVITTLMSIQSAAMWYVDDDRHDSGIRALS